MKLSKGLWLVMIVVGLGFTAGAYATMFGYEMTVAPDAEAVPMIKVEDGFGDVAAGNFGDPEWAGLQDGTHGPAGTARFSDTGANGNDGYYICGAANGFTGAFTVDMRVLGEEVVTGPGTFRAKSMSFRQFTLTGGGRCLTIEPTQLRIVGNGIIATINVDMSYLHKIRLSVPNDGKVYVYDLEGSMPWTLLNPGGTGLGGSELPAQLTAAGLAINSMSSGNTTNSKYLADWYRVDTGMARGANDPIIPEPVTLGLFLAGLPLMLRRRW